MDSVQRARKYMVVLPTTKNRKPLGGDCSVTSKIMFSLLTLLHADLAIMHTNCTYCGSGRSIAASDDNSRAGKRALKKPPVVYTQKGI
jgi:hypothetical protein